MSKLSVLSVTEERLVLKKPKIDRMFQNQDFANFRAELFRSTTIFNWLDFQGAWTHIAQFIGRMMGCNNRCRRVKISAEMSRAIIITVFALMSPAAMSTEISGSAKVIDGDTLSIGTQVIRLFGIDAPENAQNCQRKNAKSYNCGAASENALKALLQVTTLCTGSEFDNYQRLIAVCTSGGVEVNREMVRAGHALAFRKFSDAYVADEQFALSNKSGVWQGDFEKPWDFRASQWRSSAAEAPSEDCPIKGNINSKGERIYHAPWSRSYKRTSIDTQKSERWFCSEAEALAAGWRAPFR